MDPTRTIQRRHAFGVSGTVSRGLCWLDEGTLMYPVGKSIALHTVATNNQRFLDASYTSRAITALAVSANKKFVAIAESGDLAQVQIIDTVTRKRRKVLSAPDLGSDRFVSLAFSADGRHLVTQGGAPSWNLLYWSWERSKPLAAISLVGAVETDTVAALAADVAAAAASAAANSGSAGGAPGTGHGSSSAGSARANAGPLGGLPLVSAVCVCPSDPLTVTVSGIGMMRYYRYTDGVLQLQPGGSFEGQRSEAFLTHAWINDRTVVASTYKGALMLVENGKYVGNIETGAAAAAVASAGNASASDATLVECVVATTQGFIAGTSRGDVNIYEAFDGAGADAESSYRLVAQLRVPTDDGPGSEGDGDSAAGGGERGGLPGTAGSGTSPSSTTAPHSRRGGAASPASPSNADRSNTADSRGGFRVTSRRGAGGTRDGGESATPGGDSATAYRGGGGSPSKQQQLQQGGVGRLGTAGSGQERPDTAATGTGGGGAARSPRAVAGLALDQAEESLAVATAGGKIYALNVRQSWASLQPELYPAFESICQSFHSGPIRGMDCSVRKPLLITSGADRTVRVWDTAESRLVICERYRQEPGAVALHPSGLMAVVCFQDRVRVMSVLWNSLRERKTINFRNASDVKFSFGGQYFAVAHNNVIDVFKSATCELAGQLRGHPQKVTDLCWAATSPYPLDDRLVSCSQDGMIIDWSITEMRKEAEHTNKRYQYTAVTSDDRYVWAVARPTTTGAPDAPWSVTLREMDRHTLAQPSADTEEYEFTETHINSLLVAPHQRMMFGGTEDGSLKVMTFPLQAGVQESPLTAHGGRVVRLVLSFDEQTLFTASEDGSIFTWDVRDEQRGAAGQAGGGGDGMGGGGALSDEVLVTKRELEERTLDVDALRQQIERLRTSIESEEKRRNHEQGTRVREKAEEFKNDAANLSSEHAAVWNAKAEQERAFMAVKLEKEAEAAAAMEQLERARQDEVQRLEDECAALQRTLDEEKVSHAESLQALEEQIEHDKAEDGAHFKDVLQQRGEALEKLRRQVERARHTNEEARHQLELDTDAESQGVRERHQGDLRTARERFLHMKGEGAIMRKNAARMEKEIELRTSEVRLLDSAKAALTAQLAELGVKMQQLHQDIEERDSVIGDKEKKIYALKKQNQELEKHKFVLDHRIRQLKAQMEPRQREIAQYASRTKRKNDELEELHQSNLALRANAEELKQELSAQQQTTKTLLSGIKDAETYKGRVQRDVGELAPKLQDSAALRAAVEGLYQRHVVARGGERVAQADPRTREEFAGQLGYLSTSVDALRRKVKLDQERHRKEVSAMMVDNLALIREIHELRAEIATLRAQIAADESAKRSGAALAKKKARVGGAGGRAAAAASSSRQPDASEGGHKPILTVSNATTRYVGAAGTQLGDPANASSNINNNNGYTDANASTYERSVAGGGGRGGGRVGGANTSSKRPEPPREIEENRMELRMQRLYIDAMQRALAEGRRSRPPSGPVLPPLHTDDKQGFSATQ